jgi:hypothetical protein
LVQVQQTCTGNGTVDMYSYSRQQAGTADMYRIQSRTGSGSVHIIMDPDSGSMRLKNLQIRIRNNVLCKKCALASCCMISSFFKETNLFLPGPSHHSSWDSNRGIRRGVGREETRNNRMEGEDTREEEQDGMERRVENTVNGTEENTCGQCGKTFKYRKVLTLFFTFLSFEFFRQVDGKLLGCR